MSDHICNSEAAINKPATNRMQSHVNSKTNTLKSLFTYILQIVAKIIRFVTVARDLELNLLIYQSNNNNLTGGMVALQLVHHTRDRKIPGFTLLCQVIRLQY